MPKYLGLCRCGRWLYDHGRGKEPGSGKWIYRCPRGFGTFHSITGWKPSE